MGNVNVVLIIVNDYFIKLYFGNDPGLIQYNNQPHNLRYIGYANFLNFKNAYKFIHDLIPSPNIPDDFANLIKNILLDANRNGLFSVYYEGVPEYSEIIKRL